ncbi:MAG: tetratricopeptide repeat protein [Burkholderiales bacterium]|nr:tetratricopeptide repeat protein [Rhodocyclaceae bacterium]MCZ2173840.1 tetratricopeptide repeat protein [Burkholderiales bacterium]
MSTPNERAENEYRRALGLVNQGRVQEGMAVLRGALREDPGHAGSRLALFGLLVEQQRLEEAEALLQEALARNSSQPQLASRLARLQLERGDVRGAEDTLNKAAGAAAGNAEYRAFHAAVLQRLTLHREAVAEYQAALRLSPQAGVWWMGLGISLEADGKQAEAKDAFQRARATGTLSAELNAFVDQKLKRLQ